MEYFEPDHNLVFRTSPFGTGQIVTVSFAFDFNYRYTRTHDASSRTEKFTREQIEWLDPLSASDDADYAGDFPYEVVGDEEEIKWVDEQQTVYYLVADEQA